MPTIGKATLSHFAPLILFCAFRDRNKGDDHATSFTRQGPVNICFGHG